MKYIAVIYNNKKEWEFFKETLLWNLSKQDKAYKAKSWNVTDLDTKVYYFAIPNNWQGVNMLCGMTLYDYISLVNVVENELDINILSRMTGEEK